MLDGKVCLVTGAGGGIGRATAEEMARQGAAAVICADIDDDSGQAAAGLVEAAGAKALYVRCDMTDAAAIEALVAEAVDWAGGLDVLHNNAGLHESEFTDQLTVETLPVEVFDRILSLNLRGPWLAMKFAAPHLLRSERGPSIINAGSTGGLSGYPNMNAYGASKGGLIQLTRCAAVDLAPRVRVNAYAPASVDTPMIRKFYESAPNKDAVLRSMTATHLIPRVGQPIEVAKLVCYLASDDAAFITGTVIGIDGGALAWNGVLETEEAAV